MSFFTETPRRIRILSAIILLAVFFCGQLAGILLYRLLDRPREPHGPPPPLAPERLRDLGLSAEQMKQALGIQDKYRPEIDAVFKEAFPRVRTIVEKMEQEIRAGLTAEQAKKLDELKARQPEPPPQPGGPPHHHDHHAPPPEALEACKGLKAGDPCKVDMFGKTEAGTCVAGMDSSALHCRPVSMPPRDRGGPAPDPGGMPPPPPPPAP